LLRARGQDPAAVTDTAEAWAAFQEFLHAELEGIYRPSEDWDSDGFIVEWGRYSWNQHRQSLSFSRLIAVEGEHDDIEDSDEHWQPEYWQVSLELIFDDSVEVRDEFESATGHYFFNGVQDLRAGLTDVSETCGPLNTALTLTPIASSVTFDRVD